MHGRFARWRTWSACDVGEATKGFRMSCDVDEAAEWLENEPHSPTLTSLHLRHRSFSNPSTALTTSQLILQPSRCFTYVIWRAARAPMIMFRIYPWWFCNLQWLRPAGLYERCKLVLEFKRLKTPGLDEPKPTEAVAARKQWREPC